MYKLIMLNKFMVKNKRKCITSNSYAHLPQHGIRLFYWFTLKRHRFK